jgi:tRNA U34 2-thiouridine synthase MnmA/TrmU
LQLHLLQQEGYEVIGLFMKVASMIQSDYSLNECPWLEEDKMRLFMKN